VFQLLTLHRSFHSECVLFDYFTKAYSPEPKSRASSGTVRQSKPKTSKATPKPKPVRNWRNDSDDGVDLWVAKPRAYEVMV
jgi:hypothetical protein